MIVAVDFDGTCVTHAYPAIGKDIGAAPVLRRLADEGHEIVLWTMRSGRELSEAVGWFRGRGIPLLGVNENPNQQSWTKSPKACANIYIDDAALGCPLRVDAALSDRPFADWGRVEILLRAMMAGEKPMGHTTIAERRAE